MAKTGLGSAALLFVLGWAQFTAVPAVDAAILVVGDRDLGVLRVDTVTAAPIDNILPVPNVNYFVGFSADSSIIYVVPDSPQLRRFDAASGSPIDVLANNKFQHIAVGLNGTIFGAGFTNDVYSYSPTTGALQLAFDTVPQLSHITSMTVGPDGLLYVGADAADQSGTANIVRFNPATGDFVDVFVPAGVGNLNGTSGIAFGPDGNLYVSNARGPGNVAGRDILRFNGVTGAYLGVFATPFNDINTGPITDITISQSGDLYVGVGSNVVRYSLISGFDQIIVGVGEVSRPQYLTLSDELLFMPQTLATASIVPEPGTGILLLLGLPLLAMRRGGVTVRAMFQFGKS